MFYRFFFSSISLYLCLVRCVVKLFEKKTFVDIGDRHVRVKSKLASGGFAIIFVVKGECTGGARASIARLFENNILLWICTCALRSHTKNKKTKKKPRRHKDDKTKEKFALKKMICQTPEQIEIARKEVNIFKIFRDRRYFLQMLASCEAPSTVIR